MADALKAVAERAREAIKGVPAETRTANADGTTKYMRPRPGAARMYPETDIPPTLITEELIGKVRSNLPEPAEKKIERIRNQYNLNEKLSRQIADSEYSILFEAISKESRIAPTTVAVFLTETLKAQRREGIKIEDVPDDQIKEIFRRVASDEIAKEAIADIFCWLSKNEGKTVNDAAEHLGLKMLSKEKLKKLIDKVLKENKPAIAELGKNAFGTLMGIVMKEVRGKANPEVVNKLLKEKLQ